MCCNKGLHSEQTIKKKKTKFHVWDMNHLWGQTYSLVILYGGICFVVPEPRRVINIIIIFLNVLGKVLII